MSTEQAPDLSPFCQRSSIEIAADVGAAASRVCDLIDWIIRTIDFIVKGDFEPLDGYDDLDQHIYQTRDELIEQLPRLGYAFDQVAGWWVADRPPDIDPSSTSAVEVLLRTAVNLVPWLENGVAVNIAVQCKLAQIKVKTCEPGMIGAAVRCEVVKMARHPPPDPNLMAMWSRIGPKNGHANFARISWYAETRVALELPFDWESMSEAEQLSEIEGLKTPSPPPPPARRPSTPHWQPDLAVLTYQRKVIRDYRGKKPARNQWRILSAIEATGWAVRVEIPWEDMKGKKLGDAISALNEGLVPGTVVFRRDGTRSGVTWEKVKETE